MATAARLSGISSLRMWKVTKVGRLVNGDSSPSNSKAGIDRKEKEALARGNGLGLMQASTCEVGRSAIIFITRRFPGVWMLSITIMSLLWPLWLGYPSVSL